MNTIISFEGSLSEKFSLFHAVRYLEPDDLFYLEDGLEFDLPEEVSEENCFSVVRDLTQFVQKLCSTLYERKQPISTFLSPFRIHKFCQKTLDFTGLSLTNRVLYENLITILEGGLLQRHCVMIYCGSNGGKEFLLRENKILLTYHRFDRFEGDDLLTLAIAVLNYIDFINLPGEEKKPFLTSNRYYQSGINYGKVSYFNKFGTISRMTFYSDSDYFLYSERFSFPYSLNCFTTVFHD